MNTSRTPGTYVVRVISCIGAIDRRAAVADRLGQLGVPFQFYDGIEPRRTSDEMLATFRSRHKPYAGMKQGDFGCSLSYYNLLGDLMNSEAEFAVVLEDDARPNEDFVEVVSSVLDIDFDIMKLGGGYYPIKTRTALRVARRPLVDVIYAFKPSYGTLAQIIRIASIPKILKHLEIFDLPVDAKMFGQTRLGLVCLETRPYVVEESDLPSTIDPGRDGCLNDRFVKIRKPKNLAWLRRRIASDLTNLSRHAKITANCFVRITPLPIPIRFR